MPLINSNQNSVGLRGYSVGDLLTTAAVNDTLGVLDFPDGSKWARTGVWVPSNKVPSNSRSLFNLDTTRALTGYTNALANIFCLAAPDPYGNPNKVGTTSVFGYQLGSAGTQLGAMVVNDATGINFVNTGAISGGTTSATGGGFNQQIIANPAGTAFIQYYYNASLQLAYRTSTDGLTWSAESLLSLPNTAWVVSGDGWFNNSQYNTNNVKTSNGLRFGSGGPTFGAFNMGNRVILFYRASPDSGTTNYIAVASSANGTTGWTDITTSAIGNTTTTFVAASVPQFYRNGSAAIIHWIYTIGTTAAQISTFDGGTTLTYAAITAGYYGRTTTAGYSLLINNSTPSKILLFPNTASSTTMYRSINSGQSWTNLTLPIIPGAGPSITYVGSTMFYIPEQNTSYLYRSTDDGATWTLQPVATSLATPRYQRIMYDGYRYIISCSSHFELLVSTDGSAGSWVMRYLPQSISGINGTSMDCIGIDANKTIIGASNNAQVGLVTVDGGVTWKLWTADNTTRYIFAGPQIICTNTPGQWLIQGTGYSNTGATQTSYHGIYDTSQLDVGGWYRAGASAITPQLTNGAVMMRIA